MADALLTNGLRLTIDSTDYTTKLNKSVEELNGARKDWQIAAGLMYDSEKRLVDQNGHWVETLSKTQISEGKWLDSQGRLRNAQGQLIEGLNKTKLALGQYVDKLGNVCDAQGRFVQSANRFDLSGIVDPLGKFAGLVGIVGSVLSSTGEEGAKFAKKIAVLGVATQAGSTAFELASKAGQLYKTAMVGISGATKAQVAWQAILNALSGNWVGLAAGVVAAVGVAAVSYSALGSETQSTSEKTEKSIDAWKRAAEAAKQAGREFVQAGDFMKGIDYTKEKSALEELQEELNNIHKLRSSASDEEILSADQATENPDKDHKKGVGSLFYTELADKIAQAQIHANDLGKKVSDELKTLKKNFDSKYNQKTEREKIEEDIFDLKKIISIGEKSGADVAPLKKNLADAEKKLTEVTEKETAEKERTLAAEREKQKQTLGISSYLKKVESEIFPQSEQSAELLNQWNEAAKKGILSQEELATAQKNLAQATAKEAEDYKKKVAGEFGIDSSEKEVDALKNPERTEREKENLRIDEKEKQLIAKANGDQKAIATIMEQAKKARELAIAKYDLLEKKEKDKKNEEHRTDLGIDSIVEKSKSPLTVYNEFQNKLYEALKDKAITNREYDLALNSAKNKYTDTINQNAKKQREDYAKKAEEELARQKEYNKPKNADTLVAGSADVYSAWTRQNNSYQSKLLSYQRQMTGSQTKQLAALVNIYNCLKTANNAANTWG